MAGLKDFPDHPTAKHFRELAEQLRGSELHSARRPSLLGWGRKEPNNRTP
jgi:hypothetical protein